MNIWTLIFVVFFVLKLTHQIDWSWWWVTAPLWGPWAILLLCGFFVGIVRWLEQLL